MKLSILRPEALGNMKSTDFFTKSELKCYTYKLAI